MLNQLENENPDSQQREEQRCGDGRHSGLIAVDQRFTSPRPTALERRGSIVEKRNGIAIGCWLVTLTRTGSRDMTLDQVAGHDREPDPQRALAILRGR